MPDRSLEDQDGREAPDKGSEQPNGDPPPLDLDIIRAREQAATPGRRQRLVIAYADLDAGLYGWRRALDTIDTCLRVHGVPRWERGESLDRALWMIEADDTELAGLRTALAAVLAQHRGHLGQILLPMVGQNPEPVRQPDEPGATQTTVLSAITNKEQASTHLMSAWHSGGPSGAICIDFAQPVEQHNALVHRRGNHVHAPAPGATEATEGGDV